MSDASLSRTTNDFLTESTIKWSKRLLSCGIIAGPLYIILGLIQMNIRDGFDIRRHALSLLSNGNLGWIQISNFILSGLLILACAFGIRKVMYSGRGRTWGPLLVGVYGLGVIAGGLFIADPALGFPPGTPEGPPVTVSWHGSFHFILGGLGFFSLIAACFVFARRFFSLGQQGWAVYSIITGGLFLAAFIGIASGTSNEGINVAFGVAVVLGWLWISL
ncbi:DUF998 domain-containing protein [Paenibacillus xerothermodurans]|uniref:DUF998 domain-containing protein n=1 Tax=Paenibacillus xerothermodurans TaxID=1977292 RepID=A0A2W1N3T9_PAEXE|nr:DUF998 domain-containing protein [Paenibacillus xerothermodurans]PZE19007.1 DUF998 domain-containing protein [Paenibacillus xerothermodurans]